MIDATCGNGHDTLYLAQCLTEKGGIGGIIGLDIQESALIATKKRLDQFNDVHLFLQSHDQFPPLAMEHPIRLIIYNLGYFPSGNKKITTLAHSTIESLRAAMRIAAVICVTCYPGHEEGKTEEEAIARFLQTLELPDWEIHYYKKHSSLTAPSIFLMLNHDRNASMTSSEHKDFRQAPDSQVRN